jgi:hypothetical protein
MEDKEKKTVTTATAIGGLGAAAGAGIAAALGAPLLVPALVGVCIAGGAGAVIAACKDSDKK